MVGIILGPTHVVMLNPYSAVKCARAPNRSNVYETSQTDDAELLQALSMPTLPTMIICLVYFALDIPMSRMKKL